jgi:hypothetical protein
MHTGTRLPALLGPTTAPRVRLSADGAAEPVLSLLRERGWTLVDTPDANVHCTSPCGRIYLGWLPEDPSAWRREALWTIHVTPAEEDGEPWTQDFGPDVPSHAVAGFLHALLTPTHH